MVRTEDWRISRRGRNDGWTVAGSLMKKSILKSIMASTSHKFVSKVSSAARAVGYVRLGLGLLRSRFELFIKN